MMIRNSLTRLVRTPVKTALFFLLLSFTVALFCAGGSLWKLSGDNLRRFEEIFVTIGTVEQTPERTQQGPYGMPTRRTFGILTGQCMGKLSPAMCWTLWGPDI